MAAGLEVQLNSSGRRMAKKKKQLVLAGKGSKADYFDVYGEEVRHCIPILTVSLFCFTPLFGCNILPIKD